MLRAQNSEAHLARARRQIQRIRACLEPIDRLRIIGPAGSKQGMPTLAVAVSEGSSSEFASLLNRHGLMVGSGIHCTHSLIRRWGRKTRDLFVFQWVSHNQTAKSMRRSTACKCCCTKNSILRSYVRQKVELASSPSSDKRSYAEETLAS